MFICSFISVFIQSVFVCQVRPRLSSDTFITTQRSGAGSLQRYLGQYRFSCGAARSFITAPLEPHTYCVAREAPDNWWTPPNNKQKMDDEMSYDNNNNTRVTVSNPEVKLWAITLVGLRIGIHKE
jgi:hypothetical protein